MPAKADRARPSVVRPPARQGAGQPQPGDPSAMARTLADHGATALRHRLACQGCRKPAIARGLHRVAAREPACDPQPPLATVFPRAPRCARPAPLRCLGQQAGVRGGRVFRRAARPRRANAIATTEISARCLAWLEICRSGRVHLEQRQQIFQLFQCVVRRIRYAIKRCPPVTREGSACRHLRDLPGPVGCLASSAERDRTMFPKPTARIAGRFCQLPSSAGRNGHCLGPKQGDRNRGAGTNQFLESRAVGAQACKEGVSPTFVQGSRTIPRCRQEGTPPVAPLRGNQAQWIRGGQSLWAKLQLSDVFCKRSDQDSKRKVVDPING